MLFIGQRCFVLCLVIFGALGIFDTIEVAQYSALVGDTISRFRINGVATNILHLGLFAIMILIITIKQGKLTFLSYGLMMVVNVMFYYFVSYSSGGLIVTSCAVLLAAGVRYSKLIRRAVCKYGFLLIPTTIALFLYTGYQYDGTGVIEQFNHLMTGRVAYNHYWLEAYGPTLFGVSASGKPCIRQQRRIHRRPRHDCCVGHSGRILSLRADWENPEEPYILLLVILFLFSMSESNRFKNI